MKSNKENNILQITQIKLKLSPTKEIELTSDEARKVYEELGKLFKMEDKEKEYIPYPIPYNPPVIIERGPYYPPFKYWEITCASNETIHEVNKTLCINLTNKTV